MPNSIVISPLAYYGWRLYVCFDDGLSYTTSYGTRAEAIAFACTEFAEVI